MNPTRGYCTMFTKEVRKRLNKYTQSMNAVTV